ncbi:hypothetical protein C8A03DRAFT_15944 [Achaetomium macrosporum]|uniref:Transaldolase n=1 Tax=Achaetomium macrosporum TaxID=79813 RepID=A0AAN7HDI5_9PEZI|nr:hypothetical protein C8A03DRAFT_15944 [Achaetomium macrosporum]
MASLLDHLRTLNAVDCDTLDAEGKAFWIVSHKHANFSPIPTVAAKLGPFVDCTSNQATDLPLVHQAIAFAELSKGGSNGLPLYQQLIAESIQVAHWLFGKQTDATLEELAVELMMVGLSLRIAPHTTGYLHVQTNPKLAYSTVKTVKNAERIISHFKQLAPEFNTGRVCIKIPSTWEGLQACRELQKKGIATLATILFSLEQTALAADAGCRYIAPYVNELRVHFDPGYIDTNPALAFCGAAQQYLDSRMNNTTQVMAASLTSVDQVMQLAGLHHITISPVLLAELVATPAAGWAGTASIGQVVKTAGAAAAAGGGPTGTAQLGAESQVAALDALVKDESLWRMAFTRADGGRSETKLVQAINIFADVQDKLEEMVRQADATARAAAA